ncbi:fibrinogen-like YCDxxxxGGGW domain-containing protein [Aquihabitans daechungensis]|uniref:fibrinogen-like YCDxxxxGGGW domain-containing protein n=1 Tax=Aquihabitans daechungensis TaxID=1052257 RepID=UPI003B9FE330
MRKRHSSNRVRIGAVVVALLVAIPVLNLVTGNSAQAADAVPGDGTTAATAGASCWGIKQQVPASTNGVYWLNTAALERPQQFYCDMTTEGGGWVLVGRGRQGWTFNPFGQGSPATVRTTVDGPGAFTPAALDTATITALLNGQAVDTLADGVRLERATNTSGTNRQSYKLFPKATSWNWSFGAGQLLNKVVIGNTTYNGSNTRDTAATVPGQTTNGLSGRQGTDRLFTFPWASHNAKVGFSFGSGVNGGSNSSTNFLWTNANEGSPIPFTRVWIRPRIANSAAGFSPIPAGGYAASSKPATLKNKSEVANWGVVGMNHTGETTIEPYNTNVLALKVFGDRTFVGGRFTGVQNGPTATPVAQQSLAAFSIDGNFIDTFRPTVNGRVWDIAMTADNKLIIAGDFTSVNGAPNTQGMAALDPTTGEVLTTWKARAYRADGSRSFVRALGVHNGVVYAAGNFNRLDGGTWAPITVTNAVAVTAANGSPSAWRPRPNGSVVRLEVTDDGSRVLMGGYFSNVNGDTNQGYFAITDAATGNPSPGIGAWAPATGSTGKYQQAVEDLGDGRIMVGGSEHNFHLWNANRTQLIDSAITKQGGDTQAIEYLGGKIYMGCHCGDWVYEGTNNYSSPSGFRSVQPINLVGQWDPATFNYDTSWYPSGLKGAKGEGIWAIDRDARGCLWVGGDLNRGAYSGNAATDFLGGFARFCAEDVTPPSAPFNLTSTTAGAGVKLDWNASTDASGTVSYDVYRDDRVIATVYGRTFTDPTVTGQHRYTVRAVDARGNRSASPAPLSINGPSPVVATPIAFGSTWKYLAIGTEASGWAGNGFDDAAWASGPGKLGWGLTGLSTTIATKPMTTYYRKTLSVTDPSSVKTLDLKLYDMQGAVIYVNGVEAGRLNMPAGKITATTPAAGYLSAADEKAVKTVTVPGSLLVPGTNTVAVEVHTVTAGAGRQYFDLQATLYGGGADSAAPTAPALTATAGATANALTWTGSTDELALGGYIVRRDGQVIAVTGPASLGFTDGTVTNTQSHSYTVTAFDMNGNTAGSNTATLNPVADPNLLAFGANWKWFYAEGGPAADWAATAFDDSTWATGAAELGYGDADEKTIISTAPTPRPLTAYFRTTVTITDPSAFTSVLASLIRDDGAVVYVNGVEVGRSNLPAGPIAFATPATAIISDRSAERAVVPITIPSSAFVAGANTIAVEVHNSDRWSGDLSMDLKLTGQP